MPSTRRRPPQSHLNLHGRHSLGASLAHHADDPQQDDSLAQGDEEGEPVPAMVDAGRAQRVMDPPAPTP